LLRNLDKNNYFDKINIEIMKKYVEIIRKPISIDTWMNVFLYVDIQLLVITSYKFICRFIVS